METTADSRHADFFARLNLSDFPMLGENAFHVKKLIASPTASVQELIAICRQDFGLTIKVLREANAIFYADMPPVTSVAAAVGRIGLGNAKEKISTLPSLEEVMKLTGGQGIISLVARAFLSAEFARNICKRNKLAPHPDDVFTCTLLNPLGKIMTCLFLAERFRKVEELRQEGFSEDEGARQAYYGLSYPQFGQELATFWNFPKLLIQAMGKTPSLPKGRNDPEGLTINLACMANQLVEALCEGGRTNILFDRYGKGLMLNKGEALRLLEETLDILKQNSPVYHKYLLGYKIRGKILRMEDRLSGALRRGKSPDTTVQPPQKTMDSQEESTKAAHGFIDQINTALKSNASFADFAGIIMNAFHKGLGADSVILTKLVTRSGGMFLQGTLAAGDMHKNELQNFHYPIDIPGDILYDCLSLREDKTLVIDYQTSLHDKLRKLFHGSYLTLLLLAIND